MSQHVLSPTGVHLPTARTSPETLVPRVSTGGRRARHVAPGCRWVLVIGASGTVGSAVARALAAGGDRLVLHHGSNRSGALDLLAALPPAEHLLIGGDLGDADAVGALVRHADAEVGGLDVVIHAAADRSPTATLDESGKAWTAAWSSVLSVDVLAAASAAHAAATVFRNRRRRGRIVLIAAHGRPSDGPADLAREAARAALTALGQGLARELAPDGIGVTTVAAGPAAGSGWAPDDLAAAVAWSLEAPLSSLPGAVLTVEG